MAMGSDRYATLSSRLKKQLDDLMWNSSPPKLAAWQRAGIRAV